MVIELSFRALSFEAVAPGLTHGALPHVMAATEYCKARSLVLPVSGV
jgi:hypothetical protein